MKKHIFLSLALILAGNLLAQTPADKISATNELAVEFLSNQIKNNPQEKLYLQMDKPYYSAGEKLWFRAYMVHSTTHAPLMLSRYIYIELLNAHNEVILRKKIRPTDDGLFFGQINLSTELAQGWYSVRAYTNFMRNLDENYFFRQRIYIGNSLKGLTGVSIDQNNGSYNSDLSTATVKKAAFDVQFFPEGGHLIAGNLQVVGFKSVNTNGLGEDITGRLVDNQNKEILTFKSSHLGMGEIAFVPEAGKSYSAICEDFKGQKLTFSLPTASTEHYALCVKQNANMMDVSILTPNAAPRADTLYLIGVMRGWPLFQSTVAPNDKNLNMSKAGLNSGVAQILLLNGKREILSERLIYISGKDKADLKLTLDKANYVKRGDVHAAVLLKDSQGKPIEGNFSVSVTDDNDVKIDPNETTIESYLLLQSELKGNIENPNYYFRAENKSAAYELDMLMLTQGWKRYDVAAVLAGKSNPSMRYPVEQGPMISGKVQNFPARRGLPKNNVSIIIRNHFGMATTDNKGYFSYMYPEIPDSTSLTLQADKKPGSFIELVVYPDSFPKVGLSCLYPDDLRQSMAMKNFLKKSRDKYYYEKGMMSVTLKDVVVTAKKEDKSKTIREDRGAMYNNPSYSISEEDMKNANSLMNVLARIPGVMITGNGTGITMRNATPLIMVDNMEYSIDELQSINVDDVKLIDVLKEPTETMMYGNGASNGVICIYLRRGGEDKKDEPQEPSRNQAKVYPLGYSLPAAFYVPKYQMEANRVDPIPDLRTTIFWKPNVKSNAQGEADIFFYTADTPGTYTITAEGVSDQGEIIRYQGKLNRK